MITITPWRKSSYSNSSSNCVEVGTTARAVAVRDSKDPGGPRLPVTREGWREFVTRVKDNLGRDLAARPPRAPTRKRLASRVADGGAPVMLAYGLSRCGERDCYGPRTLCSGQCPASHQIVEVRGVDVCRYEVLSENVNLLNNRRVIPTGRPEHARQH